MSATGQRDTPPELAIRRRLFAMGLRYRVDLPVLTNPRRRGDIVFPKLKIAVFVDGCFWHGCPIHGSWPKANSEFWKSKIETNQHRDKDTDMRLTDAGWVVLRI
jgi:DNA mismatch endonuclease (patch repair protein)